MKSLKLTKPHLIAMVGIPGAGKSYFAKNFADTFKAPIISSEYLRSELFKAPSFSKEEDVILNRITNYMLDQILKTNQTIIYIGQTNSRSDRSLITKKTHNMGYEPLFIWVQTEQITAQKRATKRINKKLALTIDQFNNKLKKFTPPATVEKAIVISGKHTYASQIKIVLKRLTKTREKAIKQSTISRPTINRNRLIR